MPLSMMIEKARFDLVQSFNQVIANHKLPSYLYEGLLLDILAEVRGRKNLELLADFSNYQAKIEAQQTETMQQEASKT